MLVNQELMKQQAAKLNVSVTDKQLNDKIKQYEKQFGGAKKFQTYIEKQGMTMEFARTLIKNQILTQAIYDKVTSAAAVTDADMKAYWKQHSDSFQQKPTRTVRHILVKTKAQADMVRALLAADPSNANWNKVAKKYSTDPGTKSTGGNLGPISQGMMVAAFDKAAFSLKKDVISVPVKTQYGWHVLEVTAITPGKTVTYDQSKTQIKQMLAGAKQADLLDEVARRGHQGGEHQVRQRFRSRQAHGAGVSATERELTLHRESASLTRTRGRRRVAVSHAAPPQTI